MIAGFKGLQPNDSMVRFRESFDPFDDLFQCLWLTLDQLFIENLERSAQGEKSSSISTPTRGLVPGNHLRTIAREYRVPALSFPMGKPIDLFSVECRKVAGAALRAAR